MQALPLDCFDVFTGRFIRSKARKLIGRAGLTKSDYHDLLQEFAIDLIERRENFDPNKANWEAFVVVACENRYATILEHRQAEMRSPTREAGSMNKPIEDAEGNSTEWVATVSGSQQSNRTGQYRRSHVAAWDLAQDVADLLDTLPPNMRKVGEALMRDSKAAAARELGMSQGTFYEILGRVRARFEDAGLRDYLK